MIMTLLERYAAAKVMLWLEIPLAQNFIEISKYRGLFTWVDGLRHGCHLSDW